MTDPTPHRTAARWLAIALSVALPATACSDTDATEERRIRNSVAIEAISTRADMVTGGDLLVRVPVDAEWTASTERGPVQTTVRGSDGTTMDLLLSGLPDGDSTITLTNGTRRGSLDVVNHPVTGPVFSGPHAPLSVCTTQNYGMGEATDLNCSAPQVSTIEEMPLPGSAEPLSVRVTHAVINRGITTFWVADPTPDDRADDTDGWNGRLIYRYGGGCGTTYSQGFDLLGTPDPELLARGYALVTNTFNTFQVACNDVLSAETTMMVEEWVAETFGVPELTIGEGGSGGAIQALLIAQNYPGLLDAIAPLLPFPDAASIAGGVVDCALLNRFGREAGTTWTPQARLAVAGHLTAGTCTFWEQTFVPGIDPRICSFGDGVDSFSGALPGLSAGFPEPPEDQVYDPVTNPDGLRCTLQDTNVNVYGRDPATGFARRPWDNVGVQYGLGALRDSVITFDQFAQLNESIGSFDIDGEWQPGRAAADPEVVKVAYESGRVLDGSGDLRRIPVLLTNLYTDPLGDIHDRWRVFSIRDRIAGDRADAAPGLSIWTRGLPPGRSLIDSLTGAIGAGSTAIDALDRWATALAERRRTEPGVNDVEALLSSRPDDAADACFNADGAVEEQGDGIYDRPGPCTTPYPVKGDPRTVAGQDRRGDVIKCALIPISEAAKTSSYGRELSVTEQARLEQVFPDGVCDWTRPGAGQAPVTGTWQRFGT